MGLFESAQTFNGDLFVERVLPTFIPMLAGSIPISLAMGVVSYFIVLKPIRAVHKLRQERKLAQDNVSASADRGK